MRLGEILALRKGDFGSGEFRPSGTAYRGRIIEGDTDEKIHCRSVPCPPSLEFLIQTEAIRPETDLLFRTPKGTVWNSSNSYRDVWRQAQITSGMDIRPHECRHSYITHMRGAGVDDADLAQTAGHRIETMLSIYTHPVGEPLRNQGVDRVKLVPSKGTSGGNPSSGAVVSGPSKPDVAGSNPAGGACQSPESGPAVDLRSLRIPGRAWGQSPAELPVSRAPASR